MLTSPRPHARKTTATCFRCGNTGHTATVQASVDSAGILCATSVGSQDTCRRHARVSIRSKT